MTGQRGFIEYATPAAVGIIECLNDSEHDNDGEQIGSVFAGTGANR
jgi:hypothetical protein